MKEIWLTQGYKALVDDEDFEWLNQWSWCVNINPEDKTYYARRRDYKNNFTIYMHIEILKRYKIEIPKGYVGDHIDKNGINNQKENLRVVSKSKDSFNRNIRNDNISGVSGICLRKDNQKWRARISVNCAVKARRDAELHYYGITNIPEDCEV